MFLWLRGGLAQSEFFKSFEGFALTPGDMHPIHLSPTYSATPSFLSQSFQEFQTPPPSSLMGH